MEDIIHLLPDSVANQIAAGEVVQRPSSIIKEMVENSIDAGAKNVQVLVVDGGKTNVQIIDDGKGMSETDARLSFERHATSKIREAADLFRLSTMGFRGEALASIAAVAQVVLTTRREEDELGTYIKIAGSKIECQEPVSCSKGSNFSVNNLFFNVPARRKFLKKDQTELQYVVQDFERIVLTHPEVSFRLYNNGALIHDLQATTSLRQRIVDVFKKKVNAELLPLQVETNIVSISGFVGKPESSKKKGMNQYFFVNGRYMNHPYFKSAVMHAYENIIPAGEQVSFFIYFSVDPQTIDVNVHPTKTEIKFDNEKEIWQVLYATVKETLGKFCNVPMIDFDVEGKPDIPTFGAAPGHGTYYSQPKQPVSTYNPFKTSRNEGSYTNTSNWDSLYKGVGKDSGQDIDTLLYKGAGLGDDVDPATVASDILHTSAINDWGGMAQEHDITDDLVPSGSNTLDGDGELTPSSFNNTGTFDNLFQDEATGVAFDTSLPKFQYRGRYIVVPSSDGLMLVDQHRAHVRILFEQNLRNINASRRPVQMEMMPDIVKFTAEETLTLENVIDDISHLGFELQNLGNGSYSVAGVPAGIEGLNVDRLLHDLVSSSMENQGSGVDGIHESLALTMAKSTAIVYGQVLSQSEMTNLLRDLFALPTPARTPDGKKVFSVIEIKAIEALF